MGKEFSEAETITLNGDVYRHLIKTINQKRATVHEALLRVEETRGEWQDTYLALTNLLLRELDTLEASLTQSLSHKVTTPMGPYIVEINHLLDWVDGILETLVSSYN